jgi:hypothetical protein
MQTKVNIVTASVVGKHVAVVCHAEGDLSVGTVLSTHHKQGYWKVTSLGWPTLAQVQGKVTTKGIVLSPSEDADDLQEGDVLLGEQASKAAA